MSKELSEYSAETLLEMIRDDVEREEDFNYKATWHLIGRWRKGVEVEPLIKLLQSANSHERSKGSWYVRELAGRIEALKDVIVGLADDDLHACRWTVPYFMINSGYYDEKIATKLAELLVDYHLVVRKEVIKWAVHTTDERFEDFSRLIESGVGARIFTYGDPAFTEYWRGSERKRAMRGLEIARRLRNWELAEDIRTDMPEEDSFVFDGLHSSRKIIQRWLERRRIEEREGTTQ